MEGLLNLISVWAATEVDEPLEVASALTNLPLELYLPLMLVCLHISSFLYSREYSHGPWLRCVVNFIY